MAATPSILQSRAQTSSSAAPASFTASYSGATTTASLLVALVAAATSGAPTVSTPTSFTAGPASTATGIYLNFFYWPNSTSLTNVTFTTLTNVNGIAVLLFEIPNMNLTQPLDPTALSFSTQNTSNTTASNTFIPTIGNEVWLGMNAFNATTTINTLTNLPSAGIGAPVASVSGSSTTGATNITANSYVALPGPVNTSGGLRISATLNASVFCGSLLVAFTSQNSALVSTAGVLDGILVSGGAGYSVGY